MQKKLFRRTKAFPVNLARSQWLGVIILMLMVTAVTFAVPPEQWHDLLQNVLNDQGWGTSLTLFGVYALAVILLLPLSPFAISAGVFLGFWQGSLIALLAINTGALISFLLSRHWLPSGCLRTTFRSSSMRLLASDNIKVISLLRMNPLVPFSVHNYLYGAAGTDLRSYLWGTLLGSAPLTLTLVYFGVTGRAIYSADASLGVWHYIMIGLGIVLTVVLVALTKYAKSVSHSANKDQQ